uniref:Uncharacterized protein n=1 Tax=Anguilla anguilla TaxID=7936 RepID=A0A0E9Q9M2_ANGAN
MNFSDQLVLVSSMLLGSELFSI